MSEDLNKSIDDEPKVPEKPKASDRIKRMRGWLGFKSFGAGSEEVDEDWGATYYGDGHSGWNR